MRVAHLDQPSDTSRAQARPVQSRGADAAAPQGLELRHLRYLVALVDAGSFTQAAEQMFIAQPTLSQQIRRLEEIVGAPLLQRRREGLRLTAAGAVLLDASRAVLSLVDQEVNRARQAAGLGRQRLHVAVPQRLPDALAVAATSALRAAAGDDVELVWMDTALDADFSPIRERRADVGLGWLTVRPEALPAPLEAMSLGEFEPDAWLPRQHPAAARGTISLGELALMDARFLPTRQSSTASGPGSAECEPCSSGYGTPARNIGVGGPSGQIRDLGIGWRAPRGRAVASVPRSSGGARPRRSLRATGRPAPYGRAAVRRPGVLRTGPRVTAPQSEVTLCEIG